MCSEIKAKGSVKYDSKLIIIIIIRFQSFISPFELLTGSIELILHIVCGFVL
jgi:hypothetical protein